MESPTPEPQRSIAYLFSRPVWLFDLDGTLIDSSRGVVSAFHYAQRRGGETPADPERIRERIGYPFTDTVARLSRLPYERFVQDFRREAVRAMHLESELLPGARQLLRRLRDAGRRLILVTSKSRVNAEVILKHLDVLTYFESVIGADSVTHVKPDPEPIREALIRAGAHSCDAVMVGDVLLTDHYPAAGVPTLAMTGGVDDAERLAGAARRFGSAEELAMDFGVYLEQGPWLVYSRTDCPLCDELGDQLKSLRIPFEWCNIGHDEELFRRYARRIPVIRLPSGQEHDPPHSPSRLL